MPHPFGKMPWGYINKPRLVLLVALLFTALGAGVFRTTAILFMAATLCGAPIIGWILGRLFAHGLRISREMPSVGHVGQTIGVRLLVQNGGAIPAFLVTALSFLEEARAPWSEKKGGDLAGAIEIVGEPNFVTPQIPARGEARGIVRWKLRRRGVFRVPGAGVGAFDPIGLYTHFPKRGAPGELVIVPRPLPLHRLEVGQGGRGAQRPQPRPTAANAADLHGVRPYQRGESVRRVHWKSTARTGELHVVEWEEESAHDICIFLDAQSHTIAGRGGEDTLESAILAAATAVAYALENGQNVHLFWWKIEGKTPVLEHHRAHHRAALGKILVALARLQPLEAPEATFDSLVARAREIPSLPDAALLLGTDRSPLALAKTRWGGNAKTLCFECEAFETLDKNSLSDVKINGENRQTRIATFGAQIHSKTSTPNTVSGIGIASASDVIVLRPGDSIAAALEKRI